LIFKGSADFSLKRSSSNEDNAASLGIVGLFSKVSPAAISALKTMLEKVQAHT
jgi:hypothetical protein